MPNPIAAGATRTRSKAGLVRRILTWTPLLVLPVIIYVIMTWFAGSGHTDAGPAIQPALDKSIFSLPMISGVTWKLRAGDFILFLSLLLLSFEIVKATSSRSSAMVNHVASMGVLLFCLIMFLASGNFATSTFFLLTMMTLMDVLVGVIVSIVSARRDFGVGDGFAG